MSTTAVLKNDFQNTLGSPYSCIYVVLYITVKQGILNLNKINNNLTVGL